jgi:hypothetical protein
MQGDSRGLEGGNKPLSLKDRQEALYTQRLSQKEVHNARLFFYHNVAGPSRFFLGFWASIPIFLCRYLALEREFQSPLAGRPLLRGL